MIKAETIRAAVRGEKDALDEVLNYYTPYIRSCSKRTFYDCYGNHYELVDEEMTALIKNKLMYQIICFFDPDMPIEVIYSS